jgi:hypothetical protein
MKWWSRPFDPMNLYLRSKPRTMNGTIRNLAGIIAITGLLLPGCGGNDEGHEGDAHDHGAMNSGTADVNDEAAHDHADGTADHDHSSDADRADGGDAETMQARTFLLITYTTPAEERSGTTEALNGLRATLKAELEAVRGRLKQGGTDAAAKEADQERAAELAQGLERMDRLIEKVGAADDVSWADVRESSLAEAEEVRVWMEQYNMANSI